LANFEESFLLRPRTGRFPGTSFGPQPCAVKRTTRPQILALSCLLGKIKRTHSPSFRGKGRKERIRFPLRGQAFREALERHTGPFCADRASWNQRTGRVTRRPVQNLKAVFLIIRAGGLRKRPPRRAGCQKYCAIATSPVGRPMHPARRNAPMPFATQSPSRERPRRPPRIQDSSGPTLPLLPPPRKKYPTPPIRPALWILRQRLPHGLRFMPFIFQVCRK